MCPINISHADIPLNFNLRYLLITYSWYIIQTYGERKNHNKMHSNTLEGEFFFFFFFAKRSSFLEFTQEICGPNKGRKNKQINSWPEQKLMAEGKGGTRRQRSYSLTSFHGCSKSGNQIWDKKMMAQKATKMDLNWFLQSVSQPDKVDPRGSLFKLISYSSWKLFRYQLPVLTHREAAIDCYSSYRLLEFWLVSWQFTCLSHPVNTRVL